jgi:hypothetical protein
MCMLCIVTDLLVADQLNAFELCSSVFIKWFNCAKKLPGLVLCNLQFLTCSKNNTLKFFTRRIMRSAVRLSVLDFS